MPAGVGEGPVEAYATPEQASDPGPEPGREPAVWHTRFIIALGGAVVVVVGMLLGSAWTTGLRPSTFDQLRADLSSGTVQQWYAAERFESAPLELWRASASTIRGDLESPGEGQFLPPKGDPLGGILLWRTWGEPGWHVASLSGVTSSTSDTYSEPATEDSAALVAELRAAGVPMKPFEFGETTTLDWVQRVGGLLLLAGLVFGAAPRVGTRWFWFWVIINAPLALGAVAYAVMELIGFGRRPDRPLDKRVPGIFGFVGAIALSFVFGVGADLLRERGVPLPM